MSEFNLCKSYKESNSASFIVDAVLFDMDGTLVDSIAAVESAWGAVATSLGRDRQEVIDATHGRRAIDNLKDLKPHLRRLSNVEMDPHVTDFETEILRHADEFGNEVRSRRSSAASSKRQSRDASRSGSRAPSRAGSVSASMAEKMDKATSAPRRKSSLSQSISADALTSRMTSLGLKPLTKTESPQGDTKSPSPADSGVDLSLDKQADKAADPNSSTVEEDPFADDDDDSVHTDDSDLEIDTSDLTVRPSSLAGPDREAMTQPDPFILAAECLGYKPENCLVVEDSPSGIRAGVASGAKVIAVCTSHPHEKIGHCGAHWLIPTLDLVKVKVLPDKRIEISIDASHDEVAAAHGEAIKSNAPPQLLKEQMDAQKELEDAIAPQPQGNGIAAH